MNLGAVPTILRMDIAKLGVVLTMSALVAITLMGTKGRDCVSVEARSMASTLSAGAISPAK